MEEGLLGLREVMVLAGKLIVLLALLLLLLPLFAMHVSSFSGEDSILLSFKPSSRNGWYVNVTAKIGSKAFKCTGIVGVNAFYRETRSISQDLLVAPLYYIIDSVCPSLIKYLNTMPRHQESIVRLVFYYPSGYMFLSALDGRGFGSNGNYTVPLGLLLSYYLYDGIVLALSEKYKVLDYDGVRVVSPREPVLRIAGKVVEAVYCVASFLERVFGPSPRSPVAIVVAPLTEHDQVLPGTGYSLGSVLYVKQSTMSTKALIHIVAHETVHSWLGKGQLKGDESLIEGAAELLALLGLKNCSSTLYNIAYKHIADSLPASKYYSWFLIHKSLREASLHACRSDLYLGALKRLYQVGGVKSIESLMNTIADLASQLNCREELALEIGRQLLGTTPSRRHAVNTTSNTLQHCITGSCTAASPPTTEESVEATTTCTTGVATIAATASTRVVHSGVKEGDRVESVRTPPYLPPSCILLLVLVAAISATLFLIMKSG